MGRSHTSEFNNLLCKLRSLAIADDRNSGRGRGDRMLSQNTLRNDVKDIPSPPEPRCDSTSPGLHGEQW